MKRFFKGILLVGMFCVLIGCGDGSGNGTNGNTSGETEVKTSPMTHREKTQWNNNNRLRVPKNEEYSYVEGLLEDGRVFRVVEEYWFSEPTAYQAMMDKDGNQFDYCSVDSDEK